MFIISGEYMRKPYCDAGPNRQLMRENRSKQSREKKRQNNQERRRQCDEYVLHICTYQLKNANSWLNGATSVVKHIGGIQPIWMYWILVCHRTLCVRVSYLWNVIKATWVLRQRYQNTGRDTVFYYFSLCFRFHSVVYNRQTDRHTYINQWIHTCFRDTHMIYTRRSAMPSHNSYTYTIHNSIVRCCPA